MGKGVCLKLPFSIFDFIIAYYIKGLKEQLKPEILKCLKGKSFFHIKKIYSIMITQITEALQIGYNAYKKEG